MFIEWYFNKSSALFQSMTALLETEKLTDAETVAFAQYLIEIAKATNEYSSPVIEKALCRVAERIGNGLELSQRFESKKVLHVATLLRSYGGHTQLIARWMRFDSHYCNDMAILEVSSEIPDELMKEAQSRGAKIWMCEKQGAIDRALWLRKLASNYEYVVLHVHHPEVVHVLAFGTKLFKRPVLFMNHTDHLFWVGVSVSDAILNMSTRAKSFTAKKRGRDDCFVLPIPLDLTVAPDIEKDRARRQLGIPNDVKILMSCGSFYKYIPISLKKSFFWLILKTLFARKDVVAVIVGVRPSSLIWATLKKLLRDRLLLKGVCDHHELHTMLIAADIYVDSYPISGFTALCEARMNATPIVAIDTGFAYYDSLLDSCVPFDGVEERINLLLSSSTNVDGAALLREHTKIPWVKQLHDVMNRVPKKHEIWEISAPAADLQALDRTLYYHYAGQLMNLSLLWCRIPRMHKLKVMWIFVKNSRYTVVAVLLSMRAMFFKIISL